VDMQVRPEPMSNSTSRRSLPNLLGPIAVGESVRS
jgi:hypothetical protein